MRLHRLLSLSVSFVFGWIIYMIGVVVFPFDGMLSIVFQVFFGLIVSLVITSLSWLFGCIIKKNIAEKYMPSYRLHLISILFFLVLLFFGYSLGLRDTYVDLETGVVFESVNMIVGITSYILIVFLIANWPLKEKINE